jgi:hypothetical protein
LIIPETFSKSGDDADVPGLIGGLTEPIFPRKVGRPRDDAFTRSGVAMALLMEGEKVTLELLALVAGIDTSVACRRAAYGRSVIDATPALRSRISGADRRYFAERYARSNDPAIKEWLKSVGTRRRRRPS